MLKTFGSLALIGGLVLGGLATEAVAGPAVHAAMPAPGYYQPPPWYPGWYPYYPWVLPINPPFNVSQPLGAVPPAPRLPPIPPVPPVPSYTSPYGVDALPYPIATYR